ncbi:hypothetical protein [Xanthomonas phage DMF5-T1]|nr:hypothetical protein [Xanthomonas phage DMF5-T1]
MELSRSERAANVAFRPTLHAFNRAENKNYRHSTKLFNVIPNERALRRAVR